MALGEIRAALIDGDIQDLLRFGDRVQHIGEIGPQLLQRTDLRQVHGPHIDEQQERAGRQGAFQENIPPSGTMSSIPHSMMTTKAA